MYAVCQKIKGCSTDVFPQNKSKTIRLPELGFILKTFSVSSSDSPEFVQAVTCQKSLSNRKQNGGKKTQTVNT